MNKLVSFDGIGYVAATYEVDATTQTALVSNFTNPKTGNVDVNEKRLAVRIGTDGKVGFGETSSGAGTKGVYTLTISTLGIVGDKIKVGETEMTFVANDDTPEGNEIKVGATPSAAEQAENIATFLNAQSEGLKDTFTIANSSNTVTFTQKVEAIGSIPELLVTKTTDGTIEAKIETTTEGEPAYSSDDAVFGVMITYEMDGFATIQTKGYVEGVPTTGKINAGAKNLAVNSEGKLVPITGIKSDGMVIEPSTNTKLETTLLF